MRQAAHVFGVHSTKLPPVADTVGAPTPKALASTQTKVDRLKQPTGPDSVVLSANEVASLIGSSMDWSVRKSFDSLREIGRASCRERGWVGGGGAARAGQVRVGRRRAPCALRAA